MEGSLIQGLVTVMEERLGRFGRPFTTIMVVVVGLGITAWGGHMVWSKIVQPILNLSGVDTNPELLSAIGLFVTIASIMAAIILLITYVSEKIRSRSFDTRLAAQEAEIRRLRELVEG